MKKRYLIPLIALAVFLVLGFLGILATVVIVAINPAANFEDSRNTVRQSDVNTISNGIRQYLLDHEALPNIFTSVKCESGGESILFYSPLYEALVETYLMNLPTDPTVGTERSNDTGYVMCISNNQIIIKAPLAEGVEIDSTMQ